MPEEASVESAGDTQKREKGRGSPSIALSEAVALLEKIFEALGNGPFGRDSIGEAMGHKPGSGAANSKVGSLTHFGLLSRNGGGTYSISEIGTQILHPKDEAERQSGMIAAAKSPGLYSDLIEKFQKKSLPSMLGNILHREHQVLQVNADEVATRFRETMSAVGLLRNGVLHTDPIEPSTAAQTRLTAKPVEAADHAIEAGSTARSALPSKQQSFTFPASGGNIAVTWPSDLLADDVDDFEAVLQILLRRMKRGASQQSHQKGDTSEGVE